MSSSKQFKDYIIEQLCVLPNITYKSMMGEYLLYCNGILFGGIYDNRLLVKKTNSNKQYLLKENAPYNKAKPMYLIENVEDTELLKEIIINTFNDLVKKQ